MNRLISAKLLISQLLLISACSMTTPNVFIPTRADSADSEQSILYIYRPSAMSNAIYSPDILIDDEVKFAIKNTSKRLIRLKAGKHKIEIDPDKSYAGTTRLMLDLNPGENTYLRVDTKLEIKNSSTFEPYVRTFNLVKIDETSAIEEIAACCNAGNKKAATDEQKPSVKIKKDEFSVDKTQNPFSH